ncbi:MAG: amidase [Rhizobiaceae bacterium]|nr:MAG: amidase [Rhizobiaceae bacterium]
MPADFSFFTIEQLDEGFRRKAFSPVEVLQDVRRRYEGLELELNMFVAVDFEAARGQARAAEERMMREARRGSLDGIPTAVKDLIAVAGFPQRSGSKATSADPLKEDAPSVSRLRAAGAVILGKSTTSEFGCKAVGDSPLTGITRNPWNLEKTPGGSSCGSAAMVAAGLVPYALGTDGGGSIRIPAALTGLVGLKAQFGRVPVFPTSATPTLAHVGALTRTVGDAALVLDVIAGFDARDPFSVAQSRPDSTAAAKAEGKLRIAWSPDLGYGRVDAEILAICEDAVARMRMAGFDVTPADLSLEDPVGLWTSEFYAGVGTRLRQHITDAPGLLDPAVLELLKAAIGQDMRGYYENVFSRYELREKMRRFFEDYDLLLTPTLPVAAFDVGRNTPPGYEDRNAVSWVTFTYPFNLTGQPAASLPVGLTEAGLPVGLQAVARTNDEATILQFAGALQRSGMLLDARPPIG